MAGVGPVLTVTSFLATCRNLSPVRPIALLAEWHAILAITRTAGRDLWKESQARLRQMGISRLNALTDAAEIVHQQEPSSQPEAGKKTSGTAWQPPLQADHVQVHAWHVVNVP